MIHAALDRDLATIRDGLPARQRQAPPRDRRRRGHGRAGRRARAPARGPRAGDPRGAAARRRARLHDARAVRAGPLRRGGRDAHPARAQAHARLPRASSGLERQAVHVAQPERVLPPVRQASSGSPSSRTTPTSSAPSSPSTIAASRRARAGRRCCSRSRSGSRSDGDEAWDAIVAQYDGYSTREFLEERGWSEAAIELFGLVCEPGSADERVLPRAPARGGAAATTPTWCASTAARTSCRTPSCRRCATASASAPG